jgi:hypothetical protein
MSIPPAATKLEAAVARLIASTPTDAHDHLAATLERVAHLGLDAVMAAMTIEDVMIAELEDGMAPVHHQHQQQPRQSSRIPSWLSPVSAPRESFHNVLTYR